MWSEKWHASHLCLSTYSFLANLKYDLGISSTILFLDVESMLWQILTVGWLILSRKTAVVSTHELKRQGLTSPVKMKLNVKERKDRVRDVDGEGAYWCFLWDQIKLLYYSKEFAG